MTENVPSRREDPIPELSPQEADGAWPPPHDTVLPPEARPEGFQPGRLLAALWRFKWLILVLTILGGFGAYFAYDYVEPRYRVEGSIWVNTDDTQPVGAGPIAQRGLLQQTAWIDLLKSYAVLDPVVIQERLYLRADTRDRSLFQGLRLKERFARGRYVLEVSEGGTEWSLRAEEGQELERGTVGDSVGSEIGLLWSPPADELTPGRTVEFGIIHPRDAARQLSQALQTDMDRQGNFLRLGYTGTDPEKIASILQAVMEQHVSVARDLKKGKLEELTLILEEQLNAVQSELESAENALESFRVNTVILPAEESAPITPGIEQTRGPVFQDYFSRRLELETTTRDLERLVATLDTAREGGIRVESFELIPAVDNSTQLQGALTELTEKKAELRSLRQDFTEDYPPLQQLQREIRELETNTIPSLVTSLVNELRVRTAELQGVLDERSGELQQIPRRAIEEARLQRRVAIADQLYVDLRQRYETAKLAAASSIPDVRILDDTQVPSVPAEDRRLSLAGMVFLAFLGLGVGGALLWDRVDPRLRYVSDVSGDLGIEILGVIPRLRTGRKENASEVFEAFRDIRMRTAFAHGTSRPIVLTVTSPDQGEGKTFVSANLATAFAQLGDATLLIDGDTRRGNVHELFHVERRRGLTDLLEGRVRSSVIHSTSYEHLDILPSGSRRAGSPELLSSSRMQQALAALKARYDVIIIDSPPMSAGSDPFVIGAHAGNLILVMRSGSTNKDLAKGKLETFLRLPVRILGGVLNDIEDSIASVGYYRHYSYYHPDYLPENEMGETESEELDSEGKIPGPDETTPLVPERVPEATEEAREGITEE